MMKKLVSPSSGCTNNLSDSIKTVMMQGMFYTSDDDVSVGFIGEDGDVCHDCTGRYFLPRHIEHYTAYSDSESLFKDILASRVSYGVIYLGRSDKGSNFSLLDKLLVHRIFIKDKISFSLNELKLYSRRTDETDITTVYVPVCLTEAEWVSTDNSINVYYAPTINKAISLSMQRNNTAVLAHDFSAAMYHLHETNPVPCKHSGANFQFIILSRRMPVLEEARYIIFRKEILPDDNIYEVLSCFEGVGLSICSVETQLTERLTRLYITAKMMKSCLSEKPLIDLGIREDEFLGAF